MSNPPDEPATGRPRYSDNDNVIEDDQASVFSSTYADSEAGTRQRWTAQQKRVARLLSFLTATICALCGGSIVVFSLYAPLFQSRLHYTQLQVNAVAIAGSIALYLPISVLGYICDRVGTAPLALFSAVLFAVGYGLAAAVYHNVDLQYNSLGPDADSSVPLMMFAFICIGAATCSIYMASLSSCAKNFGKGRFRGLAMATPITAFGLSPMWLSQVGSRLFVERRPDGSKEMDVYRFFIFLAILLFSVSVLGILTLRVVDEQDLIEEAIEELEHSGLLDGSSLLGRSDSRSYGAVDPAADEENGSLLDPTKDEDIKWKKNWVLNAETRRFLSDRTMWLFAAAFLLMVGPGEAFINNLGTVIGTLTMPASEGYSNKTSAATHVSIFGVTSTLSRILIGTLTDLVAPSPNTQHIQVTPHRSGSSRFAISRVAFMLFFAFVLSFGLAFLASGVVQGHADRFWVVSGFVGAGYGAVFSLTPLIVTIVYGVENFSTNFGIIAMLPAVGSTFWGLIYSAVYQAGTRHSADELTRELFCYGQQCYSSTFWAQAVTVWIGCGFLLWAWKGAGGWQQRGIII